VLPQEFVELFVEEPYQLLARLGSVGMEGFDGGLAIE
jgi:hypothetical protein